jgi:translation initiation factor 1 (eIF-1/SUI1)
LGSPKPKDGGAGPLEVLPFLAESGPPAYKGVNNPSVGVRRVMRTRGQEVVTISRLESHTVADLATVTKQLQIQKANWGWAVLEFDLNVWVTRVQVCCKVLKSVERVIPHKKDVVLVPQPKRRTKAWAGKSISLPFSQVDIAKWPAESFAHRDSRGLNPRLTFEREVVAIKGEAEEFEEGSVRTSSVRVTDESAVDPLDAFLDRHIRVKGTDV